MAETTTPTRSDAEALDELRDTFELHRDVVASVRRTGIDDALFELVYFRGMSTNEAGEHLGVTGQAIRKRLRPLAIRAGIDGLSWADRTEVDVPRPFARLSDAALLSVLLDGDRALAAQAREIQGRLRAQLLDLHDRGHSYIELAGFLDVDRMRIFRVVWAKP